MMSWDQAIKVLALLILSGIAVLLILQLDFNDPVMVPVAASILSGIIGFMTGSLFKKE